MLGKVVDELGKVVDVVNRLRGGSAKHLKVAEPWFGIVPSLFKFI